MVPDPLRTPSRIAFAGDWHANSDHAADAVRHAADRGAETLIHLGDFAYRFRPEFLLAVEAELSRRNLPLLFIDGNHDDPGPLRRRRRPNGLRRFTDHIWHLPRGFRWAWGDVLFLALGGAYSIDRTVRDRRGLSWWPQEVISPRTAQRVANAGHAGVLVAHDCPAGVPISCLPDPQATGWAVHDVAAANDHRRLLRTVVDAVQPTQIWHGHYHVAYESTVDLGYGPVSVTGLDCDNNTTLDGNVRVVDLADLAPKGADHAAD